MVEHLIISVLKNTTDNNGLFISICFPKMPIFKINLNFFFGGMSVEDEEE